MYLSSTLRAEKHQSKLNIYSDVYRTLKQFGDFFLFVTGETF